MRSHKVAALRAEECDGHRPPRHWRSRPSPVRRARPASVVAGAVPSAGGRSSGRNAVALKRCAEHERNPVAFPFRSRCSLRRWGQRRLPRRSHRSARDAFPAVAAVRRATRLNDRTSTRRYRAVTPVSTPHALLGCGPSTRSSVPAGGNLSIIQPAAVERLAVELGGLDIDIFRRVVLGRDGERASLGILRVELERDLVEQRREDLEAQVAGADLLPGRWRPGRTKRTSGPHRRRRACPPGRSCRPWSIRAPTSASATARPRD